MDFHIKRWPGAIRMGTDSPTSREGIQKVNPIPICRIEGDGIIEIIGCWTENAKADDIIAIQWRCEINVAVTISPYIIGLEIMLRANPVLAEADTAMETANSYRTILYRDDIFAHKHDDNRF